MATPTKIAALTARPNWMRGLILFHEQEHGPLPDDVVETQGQNLVTQCPNIGDAPLNKDHMGLQPQSAEDMPPQIEHHSQAPMLKNDPRPTVSQKGKCNRPAPMEEYGPGLRRSERFRLKREQAHEEGEDPSTNQAMGGKPTQKRARMTLREAPRDDRHGVRRSERLVR